MFTPNSPADPDDQAESVGPENQVQKDNKTIDRMVLAWVVLGVLAFIIMAVV